MREIFFATAFLLVCLQNIWAQPAPNFTITDYNGTTHRLYEDYLDQGKTVVIDIFFVGCPPCAQIAPFTQDLYEDWGSGEYDVEFFGLSNKAGDMNSEVRDWKNQLGTAFPGAGFDGNALTAIEPYLNGTYGLFFGTPTFVVIAPDRTVQFNVNGSGVSGKIEALDNAIRATGAVGKGDIITPSNYTFNFTDAFGNNVDDVTLTIASSNLIGPSYELNVASGDVLSILNIEDQFPDIQDPTFYFTKATNDVSNKISTIDIINILKHIINVDPFTSNDLILAADANGDGTVSSIDLITLQKIVLGIFQEYPNGGTGWEAFPQAVQFDIVPNANQTIDIKMIRIGDTNDF